MELLDIAIVFAVLIIVVLIITSLTTSSRFTKTTSKDTFKDRKTIGNEYLGKTKKDMDLQKLARVRNLDEGKKIEPNMPISKATLATSRAVIEMSIKKDKEDKRSEVQHDS